ncbi:MAG: SH3 domain-containing protein [Candidatus Gorgyraea atricola]|nr:SH3 domain-containing protein [Candidatus Gorgyraea atricola]
MKILAVTFCVVLFACGVSFSLEEEALSKIGFAKSDGANVRAGDNVNYEILGKLKKGDPVKIIDKRYSWFKVVLPETAHLYIKNDYVDIIDKKGVGEVLSLSKGEVNATRVNLRAGPGTKYSILGQASKPQELQIVSEKDDWYEVKPPEKTTGWIHASQVMFNLELVKPEVGEVKKEASPERPIRQTQGRPEQEKRVEGRSRGIKGTFSKGIILERKAPEPKGNLTFSTQSQ